MTKAVLTSLIQKHLNVAINTMQESHSDIDNWLFAADGHITNSLLLESQPPTAISKTAAWRTLYSVTISYKGPIGLTNCLHNKNRTHMEEGLNPEPPD